jgi:hypothetical protein
VADGGVTTAAVWRFTLQRGLVLGSTKYFMSADADFQCEPERQLTWALKSTAEKMAPGCIAAPEPSDSPKRQKDGIRFVTSLPMLSLLRHLPLASRSLAPLLALRHRPHLAVQANCTLHLDLAPPQKTACGCLKPQAPAIDGPAV